MSGISFKFEPVTKLGSKNIRMEKNNHEKLINSNAILLKIEDLALKRIDSVKELISLPKKGFQYRLITQKSFSSVDFLKWVCDLEPLIELNIAVYRMNLTSVTLIKSLVTGGVQLNLVLSSFFRTSKKAEVWHDALVAYAAGKNNIKICYCVNHAKVMCIRTPNNWYVFEGSGNMSGNARIEQYIVDNSKKVYDFHSAWIQDLVNG